MKRILDIINEKNIIKYNELAFTWHRKQSQNLKYNLQMEENIFVQFR